MNSARAFLRLLLAACAAVLLAGRPAWPQDGAGLERAVKATYLYKFAPFVEWPQTALPAPQTPLLLCVLGDNSFARLVEQAVASQRNSGRPVSVRPLAEVTRNSGCDILFAAGSPRQSVDAALAAVRGAPVLTVTDSRSASQTKGIINFVMQDGHVRFEIDNAAAAASGLVISSKLLSLAVDVVPKS